MYSVAAFYKFSAIGNPNSLQLAIRKELKKHSITGTILVGEEGLNGTIVGEAKRLKLSLDYIKSIKGFKNLDIKYSFAEQNPFIRLKIKLKKEIVTIGDKSINPNEIVGKYVNPEEWNKLISDKNTILIDTRNDYEYSIGTFKNSINPNTVKFREFPEWVKKQNFTQEEKESKKFAMFCTGGIRCEKASSFMKKDGFRDVSHLKGGILSYFESVNTEDTLWEGECFVFDDRVSVMHDLSVGSYDMCHGCRMPITEDDKQSSSYIKGVACPKCFNKKTEDQKTRYMSRQKQVDLATKRNQKHIGPKDEAKKNNS
jgi:UPF0176 protein|tara:strand:- start:691 stop:1629 length:939 start_codon:yes stop_codon:yes gene_type:complete